MNRSNPPKDKLDRARELGWEWVASIDEDGKQCRSMCDTLSSLNRRLELGSWSWPIWQTHELP